MKIIELSITAFSKEGHGLGVWMNPQGLDVSVEVPFTIPGDQVIVELVKKRKGLYESRLLEITTPSPDRMTPRCIHFGSCGGCRWQQISYADQLKIKEDRIKVLLSPYLHKDVKWNAILACTPPWEYRNKMELSFSSDKAQNHYLGLILYGSRGKVFQMKECHLAHPWMTEAVKAVRQWWDDSGLDAYHMHRDTGSLRTLVLREGQRSGDRLAMLTVSGNPAFALHKDQLDSFVAALQAITPTQSDARLSIFLRIQVAAKGQPTSFFEMLLDGPDYFRETLHIVIGDQPAYSMTFRISPSAFFQPNTRQAEQLYSKALTLAQIQPDSLVYDLYCGTGTLGLCAAKQAKEVIGIELSPESVVDARENIKLNGVKNILIRQGDVGQELAKLEKERKQIPDIVMVDPPRAGLDAKAIQHLLELKAPKLIYISCNPITQAANLEFLIKGGYKIDVVQPVDQFPQTIHCENIVVLTLPDIQEVL